MNKSFKSLFNKSTGTYVAAGENVKSRGKSSKNKLAMKLASASLAFGASVAMLSPMEASADESVPTSGYMADAPDVANAADTPLDEVVSASVEDIASPGTGSTGGTKLLGSQMLGAQLLGATPTGASVLYDDPTNGSITFQGTAGTKLSNVAAGTISATSMDAVNGSQLFNMQATITNGSTPTNSAYMKVGGKGDGSDNAVLGTYAGDNIALGSNAKADTGFISNATVLYGQGSIAIGGGARAIESTGAGFGGQIAIGGSAISNRSYAIAIGAAASATGLAAVALGIGAKASGSASVAEGSRANASADGSVALGSNSVANVANTVSVGAVGSERQVMNVAAGTRKTDAVNYGQLQAAGLTVDTSGNATNAFVAYDDMGEEKITLAGTAGTTITNVKAGDISSATSTDAVNGSQLFATNQNVAKNATDITSLTSSINAFNDGSSGIVRQDTLTQALNVGANLNGNMIDFAGLQGARTLTGVANGTVSQASTDAMNGSQLFNASKSVATALGSGAGVDVQGGVSAPSYSVGGATVNDVGSAVSNLDGRVTQNSADIASIQGGLAGIAGTASNAVAYDSPDHSKITLGGTTAGAAAVKMNNLAAGDISATSTDAVNGSQLSATNDRVTVTENSIANIEQLLGSNSTASGSDATAAGSNSTASGDNSTAAGSSSTASGDNSTAAGASSTASGDNSTAAGANSTASGDNSTAAGSNSTASGDNSTAAGSNSTASGNDSTATGGNASASGDNSTANGANSTASGNDSTATGGNASASGNNSTASGANSMASGDNSTATGGNASASGSNTTANGANSQASGSNAVAFGANSVASGENSVALGANSVASEANTVSVGSAGNERRITNVAPGVNGTDAVNLNQMSELRNDISSSINTVRRAAYGGIAAAMAMPNLMPSAPGKTVVGAGAASYKGMGAIAAGVTYRSQSGHWLVNGAASATQQGDVGVRAQAGYEF